MDEGKILLVNLAKGSIGEDTSNLLGSLLGVLEHGLGQAVRFELIRVMPRELPSIRLNHLFIAGFGFDLLRPRTNKVVGLFFCQHPGRVS